MAHLSQLKEKKTKQNEIKKHWHGLKLELCTVLGTGLMTFKLPWREQSQTPCRHLFYCLLQYGHPLHLHIQQRLVSGVPLPYLQDQKPELTLLQELFLKKVMQSLLTCAVPKSIYVPSPFRGHRRILEIPRSWWV